MSNTKISEEFKKAENSMKLTSDNYNQLLMNGVDSRFTNLL